ncbi:MAG: hypothetical protein K0S60_702 [Evtepia sp.]|jgi:hypothetical protein|nr:hypothetical protein [Evtepia sp.]
MDNTEKRIRVDPRKLTDLQELKNQMEKLTETQKMFIAGAVAALGAKLEKA